MNGRHFRLNSLLGHGEIGFATVKKIGCHARRNRQKRRAREAYNALAQENVGLDIAVLVRESADKASFDELTEELGRLLEETRRRWAGSSGSR